VYAGWVSVGIDQDTAEFPLQTIRSWWHSIKRRGKSVQTTGASSVHSSGFTSRACDRSANHAPPRCFIELKIDLPKRSFFVVRHREQYASQAEKALFASFRM
jgi:Rhodopirellula transposase DDE domain